MTDPVQAKLLVDVSTDYYLGNRSKVEIAKEHGISRFQVARMLVQARELGIVRIEISPPAHLDGARAGDLAAALGVSHVHIARTGEDGDATRASVAAGLAAVVRERAVRGMTLGVSWSRTVELAARDLAGLPPCDVVQLVGALPVEGSGNSVELIHRFKAQPGVRTWPIWAPLVVDDAATAAGLRRQPEIAQTLDRAGSLDLAVVAIGAWSAHASTVYDLAPEEDRRAGRDAGAVAECSGRLFDDSGAPVRTALDERVVGVTIEQLVRTPEVVAVGYGAEAARGLCAAVRGGFASVLVVDEACARELATICGAGAS
ncbi:sugar-binding transcriptional regulator [Sanguibacter suaedae]|uniref:sugar-binding transcriptional regulator n=1 Tax=Sanguibacter suaedae TaxID=2795737 RepID=UPI0027DDC1E2|nr:sugar-binding domain-containing protein [Sanguibacter suaedae]